jgi:hypothetical protein
MVMFNSVQWTGNYNAAGVGRLTADMSNFGSTALHMRIAIRGGPGSSNYASVAAVDLPADGAWHPVAFDLTPSAMTNINGGDPLANVLTSVAELRILSAATPSSNGDSVEGTLGMDNLRAIDVAALSLRVTEILLTDVVPRVRFTTVSGRSYRVERKNALSETMWTQVVNAENVSGTGGIVEVSDTEPGAGNLPARFYHVVLLAP